LTTTIGYFHDYQIMKLNIIIIIQILFIIHQ
jgi:hypothetical protein